MATTFPTSLQDLDATRGTSGDKLNNPNHITHHQKEDDTIEALQTKVGIDSSADATSLDYLVKNASSNGGGHVQTAAKGGTGQTTYTKGDILAAASASVLNKLAVGTNGQLLVADSSATNGVKWGNMFSESLVAGETIDATSIPQAVYIKAADGKVYKTDADADESGYGFIGFVPAGASYNNLDAIPVYYEGVISGFTGLTIGANQYIHATAGTISETPDTTRTYKVARAISATQVKIELGEKIRVSDTTLTTTPVTVTVGFRPSRIWFSVSTGFSNNAQSVGMFDCASKKFLGAQAYLGNLADTFTQLYDDGANVTIAIDATNGYKVEVDSVSATGFVLSESGGSAANPNVKSIAYG